MTSLSSVECLLPHSEIVEQQHGNLKETTMVPKDGGPPCCRLNVSTALSGAVYGIASGSKHLTYE